MSVTVPSKIPPTWPERTTASASSSTAASTCEALASARFITSGKRSNAAATPSGTLPAVRDCERGFDNKAIGEPAKRRGGVGISGPHRRMPRPLAPSERRVARMSASSADGQHERCLLGIVRVEIALPLLEAHIVGPFDAECPGAVAKSSDRPIVRLGHDSEKAGPVSVEKVSNREICSK